MPLSKPRLTANRRALLKDAAAAEDGRAYFTDGHRDRTASDLAGLGLGEFANFKHHYSWRPRDGYVNHFRINEAGRAAIKG